MTFFSAHKIYNFMSKRTMFLGFSIILSIASIALLTTKGLHYGIDFDGGTIVQVKYNAKAPMDKIRTLLKSAKSLPDASVSKFGSDDEVIIRLDGSSSSFKSDVSETMEKILKPSGSFEIRRVNMVGPKVGGELRSDGITAFVLSLIVIMLYVSFRFDWRSAIASVVALAHDTLIALGALSLFSVDINLPILAAILTLLGYSLNDTIIVFDRVRESLQTCKDETIEEVINESVSKTLSRTMLTSLTVFLVVLTLYVFGGAIIHGFSFTMLVGVIIGTYSSVFVAASLLVVFKFSIKDFKAKETAKIKRKKEKERMRAMYEKGTI